MTGYRMMTQMVAVAIASLALAIPARVSAQGNNTNPPHENQGGNQGVNRGGNTQQAVACPLMDDMSGSSFPAVFKRLIADIYERNGKSRDENLKNVSVTIHFSDFKIGPTHSYRGAVDSPYNPDGPGGNGREPVYPVKTTYLVCEDHPTPTGSKGEIITVLHEAMTYSCYRDDTGDWRCNQTGGTQGQPERTVKR